MLMDKCTVLIAVLFYSIQAAECLILYKHEIPFIVTLAITAFAELLDVQSESYVLITKCCLFILPYIFAYYESHLLN